MDKVINFIDTTTRDGSQSNWAAGMPVGMMDVVIEDIDKVGYSALDCPLTPLQFKKIVRDLKEDPWEMIKMFGKKAPNTKKGSMLGPGLRVFDSVNDNREAVQLFLNLIIEMGALQRAQLADNVVSSNPKEFSWFVPFLKKRGVEIAFAISYYISPRHTDAFYIKNLKMAADFGADVIYLKDAGGLLDIDNVRRVFTLIQQHSNGVPLEIHGHCTTGLADAVYVEAAKLGCRAFHVGTPPLAEGTAQPSVFNTVENMKALGFETKLDMDCIQSISKRLYSMAKEAGLPYDFGPTRYNAAQYIHRIPGGVISNLKHQLRELHLQDRLDEVIEECIRICAETGEPHMITPYSQFVCTQAAINVALGERYKIVIDDFIQFALGFYGEDSGYLEMDQDLRDKFVNLPRAAELIARRKRRDEELSRPLREIRNMFGANLSDEEFLLRYMMKGTEEIEAMREATKDHPFKLFSCINTPILELIDELGKQTNITQVQVQCQNKSLTLKKQCAS